MFNTYFFYTAAGYRDNIATFVNGVVKQEPKFKIFPYNVLDILTTERECEAHYGFNACVVTGFQRISKEEYDTYMSNNKGVKKPVIRRIK